jgi:hypothetical protein
MLAAVHVFIDNSPPSPLLTTLLPAVAGAVFGVGGSLLLRRGEHDWQERREVATAEQQAEQQRLNHQREVAWQERRDRFARDLQVAKPLDDALVEVQRRVQGELVPEGESRWMHAHAEWQNGWVRVTPHLTDGELEERYQAVGTILLELEQCAGDEGFLRGAGLMVASRAIVNARLALAYFLRGEPLPPACFPGPRETNELLGQGDPDPLKADMPLRRWLTEHEVPPWR